MEKHSDIHSAVHTYTRQDSGILEHRLGPAMDIGGDLGATGDVLPLMGWPTPAMRQAVDGAGNPVSWYIGTDEHGEIVWTTY